MDGDIRQRTADDRSKADDQKPGSDPKQDGQDHKAEGDEPKKPPMPRWKKLLYGVVGLIVLAALITAGVLYWLHARHFESTDDAFIDGYMSQVASRIAGPVTQLAVQDNQRVAAGQLLVAIDSRDFEVRLDQSRAQAANAAAQAQQARADLIVQRANVEQQEAQVRVADADLGQAQQDFNRYHAAGAGAVARQQIDQSSSTSKSAAARLDSARQGVAAARAQIETQQARIAAAEASQRQAEADVRNAELQLSYTRIVAPQAGQVTRRTVNLGNYVSPGQALLAIVPDEIWVTANFKETQLTDMRPGQPVEIEVDAYAKAKLHGHVDSFQRGTGAVFSSLPAENATGNYVKVVQRLPVKILFDGDDWRKLPLSPGLSVAPRVTVR